MLCLLMDGLITTEIIANIVPMMPTSYYAVMQKLIAYCKARFPAGPLFVFFLLTVLAIENFPDSQAQDPFWLIESIALFLLFFFHLRILDEFKDNSFDSKNFPDRPLQSGLVNKKTLYFYGIATSLIMLPLSWLVFGQTISLFLFILAWAYSFIMLKEFWIDDFWQRASVLYVISHEVALVILYLAVILSNSPNFIQVGWSSLALLFAVFHPVLLIEFGRKNTHRHDPQGEITQDTYAAKWGQDVTTVVMISLCVFSSVGLFIAGHFSATLGLISLSPVLLYSMFRLFANKAFYKNIFLLTSVLALAQLATFIFLV